MSAYTATLTWRRGEQPFSDGKYSRGHDIAFDGGFKIAGSSSPHVVRPPLSREDAADPEELFVAALASCHMLFFLDFARHAKFLVESYEDEAEGLMEKGADGKVRMTRVTLRPKIRFGGERAPSETELAALNHRAHEACYIANSVTAEIVIENRRD